MRAVITNEVSDILAAAGHTAPEAKATQVNSDAMLQVLVRECPGNLVWESEDEAKLVAVARAFKDLRGKLDDDEDALDEVRGLSIDIAFEGHDEGFSATAYPALDVGTNWASDGEEALDLLQADLADLRRIVEDFESSWIADYEPPELANAEPIAESRTGWGGTFVTVYPEHVVLDRWTADSHRRQTVEVGEEAAKRIAAAMDEYDLHDANRVIAAQNVLRELEGVLEP
ncbi:hypothetical protein GAY28_00305 [Azospirillum brasilense]|nr:hypothetical protein [Azospirillum brasilense]